MGRPKNHHRSRSSGCLSLEQLEIRQLFAADSMQSRFMAPMEEYVGYRLFEYVAPSAKLTSATTESSFDAKLKTLVGDYWSGVLGKTSIERISTYYEFVTPALGGSWVGSNRMIAVGDMSVPQGGTWVALGNTTNTHHENIDEADQVDISSKGYLYSSVGGSLYVSDLRDPANITTTLVTKLEDIAAQLFVVDDTLLVLQNIPIARPLSVGDAERYVSQTKISVYDVSSPMAPRIASTTIVDGANHAARLTAGQLTLVQTYQLILPLPTQSADADGVLRYESLDSYYAKNRNAIIAELTPNYAQSNSQANPTESLETGDWEDIALANDKLTTSTSVTRFQLSDHKLALIDSENVVGLIAAAVYQGPEDLYLISMPNSLDKETKTYITKIDATADGQLKAKGTAEVIGSVNESWLNEHNGVLQVASLGRTIIDPDPANQPDFISLFQTVRDSANITTIGDTPTGWKVLGSLVDLADGQSLLAANFMGDRAVLTTGQTQGFRRFDPLHGIDLSDPAHPVENSELTIPGFTTYLKRIDETHWLGLGYDSDPMISNSALQVSIYDVADLANPKVVDRWVSDKIGWWGNWDPHNISYDSRTGYLTIVANQRPFDQNYTPTPVLKIDVHADKPIKVLGEPAIGDLLLRSFTTGDTYVAVSSHKISTFNVADLSKPLDISYLDNLDELNNLYWFVSNVAPVQIPPFSRFWGGEPFEVTKVESTGSVIATLNPDQSITLSLPSMPESIEHVTLTLKFQSGKTQTVTATVNTVFEQRYVANHAAIKGRFVDDEGNDVVAPSAGDEVWVVMSAVDTRELPQGLYSAYVNVKFDSQNVTVIGDPEQLGQFTNGRSAVVSSNGIDKLGGFGGNVPSGLPVNDFAHFKIRIENSEPVTISFTSPSEMGYELLFHGLDKGIDPANIEVPSLTNRATVRLVSATAEPEQDLNSDGVITALDVLQIVNYINDRNAATAEMAAAQFTDALSRFDISGDGIVSGLDVLQIVNTINGRNDAASSGEGEPLSATAVDQLLAIDYETLKKK